MTQAWRETPQDELESARVQIGWREEKFWVFAQMSDSDIFNPAKNLNEETYKLGDAFEIFLRDKRCAHYLELHVSPFNQQMQLRFPCARESGNEAQWKGEFVESSIFQSWTQVAENENRWSVLAAISITQISDGESIQSGAEWLCSFSRYDYTRGQLQPILSSTSQHQELDFHRQQDWRTLVFC